MTPPKVLRALADALTDQAEEEGTDGEKIVSRFLDRLSLACTAAADQLEAEERTAHQALGSKAR